MLAVSACGTNKAFFARYTKGPPRQIEVDKKAGAPATEFRAWLVSTGLRIEARRRTPVTVRREVHRSTYALEEFGDKHYEWIETILGLATLPAILFFATPHARKGPETYETHLTDARWDMIDPRVTVLGFHYKGRILEEDKFPDPPQTTSYGVALPISGAEIEYQVIGADHTKLRSGDVTTSQFGEIEIAPFEGIEQAVAVEIDYRGEHQLVLLERDPDDRYVPHDIPASDDSAKPGKPVGIDKPNTSNTSNGSETPVDPYAEHTTNLADTATATNDTAGMSASSAPMPAQPVRTAAAPAPAPDEVEVADRHAATEKDLFPIAAIDQPLTMVSGLTSVRSNFQFGFNDPAGKSIVLAIDARVGITDRVEVGVRAAGGFFPDTSDPFGGFTVRGSVLPMAAMLAYDSDSLDLAPRLGIRFDGGGLDGLRFDLDTRIVASSRVFVLAGSRLLEIDNDGQDARLRLAAELGYQIVDKVAVTAGTEMAVVGLTNTVESVAIGEAPSFLLRVLAENRIQRNGRHAGGEFVLSRSLDSDVVLLETGFLFRF